MSVNVSSPAALRAAIEAEAHRLGFERFGITTPDPPPHAAVFESWLAQGRHGEMAYLDSPRSRQRRLEPRQILPECQSIIVLGMRYAGAPPGRHPEAGMGLHGRVAAYAWGDDYHDVLVERLQALAALINLHTGEAVLNRWYTDTGPLLERDLAQRAGLGWIGKNTCLIAPQSGSYFLLAELLLALELPPDAPFATDHCGTCTRCLEACPTGCILPDRTIDARRCISYLTIELKGPIPRELRPALGEWVFGCDICQQVCPWNVRFAGQAAAPVDPAFQPRPGLPYPDLLADLHLTPEAFNRKFKGSPVRRTRRRGYLRNLAVALGNLGDVSVVPHLEQALDDPEALVRIHAAWALGRLSGAAARAALAQAVRVEGDAWVQEEMRLALEEAAQDQGVP